MLALVAAIGIGMGWAARSWEQRAAVADLCASNPAARVVFAHELGHAHDDSSTLLARLRRQLGVDYFSNAVVIELSYATDPELRLVARLPRLSQLYLLRIIDVTDKGLGHLRALTRLKKLVLVDATNVGDEGLEYLAGLSSLEELTLNAGSRVTESGIKKLGRLQHLKRLEISCRTADAAAALDEVRRLLPHCRIGSPAGGEYLELTQRGYALVLANAALPRFSISSGATSSVCVDKVHSWPNGSVTVPERSP